MIHLALWLASLLFLLWFVDRFVLPVARIAWEWLKRFARTPSVRRAGLILFLLTPAGWAGLLIYALIHRQTIIRRYASTGRLW